MNKCIHFVAPFFLIGCGLRNVDKPAPSSYELWKKDGMSIVEVQIDMLECGYPNPMGYFESTFEDGGVNAFAMAGRCLKRIDRLAGIPVDGDDFGKSLQGVGKVHGAVLF